MGVDTLIYLPTNCSVCNIANVMAAYAGLKAEKKIFSSNDGYYVEIETGVSVKNSHLPGCVGINMTGDVVDGEKNHYVLFHYEASYKDEARFLLMPRSTKFWIAIGYNLVKFFGGELIYQDISDETFDYGEPVKSLKENRPSDNQEWYDLQNRILAIKPLTQEEIDFFQDVAAY